MNRRMFGNLWARRAQLSHRLDTLRHSHLWASQNRSNDDHQRSQSMQDAAWIGPPDRKASAHEQRNALTTWEDEGGTTKLVKPR